LQFLTAEFIVYCLFNVNCQAQLGEIWAPALKLRVQLQCHARPHSCWLTV